MSKPHTKTAGTFRFAIYASLAVLAVFALVLTWLWAIELVGGFWLWGAIAAIAVLSFAVVVVAVIWRSKIWPRDALREEQRALKAAVAMRFRDLQVRAKKVARRKDALPIHVFLNTSPNSASTMVELGYMECGQSLAHKGLDLSTWSSQSAVALRIDIDASSETSFELVSALSHRMRRYRPTLPVNAIFIELEIGKLGVLGGGNAHEIALTNMIANQFVDEFGIEPPVHVVLVGLERTPDLVRTELLTEKPGSTNILGGFLETGDRDSIEASETLLAEMTTRLDRIQIDALRNQVAPDFCASLVNAPFQMELISAQLLPVLRSLVAPQPPRSNPLSLHSIVFAGSTLSEEPVDPLGQLSGQRYFETAPTLIATHIEDSITSRRGAHLANAYHLESYRPAQNWRAAAWERLKGAAITYALIFLVGCYALACLQNYRSYGVVNADIAERFDSYFSSVGEMGLTSDTLVSRILALNGLREGLRAYDELPVAPIPRWVPNWSMETHFRDQYANELLTGYQASLADYLERDLFAYNALADGVTLFALALLEIQFFTDQRGNAENLSRHFVDQFAAQGEVSAQFTQALKGTLDDLFALNTPNPDYRNSELRQVVARTLANQNTADVLYQQFLRQPEFAARVDLRQDIGPRFSEVFDLSGGADLYLVKSAFTRAGFEAMYKNGEVIELRDTIADYELLIGELEPAAINAILRRVSELYTSDYIGHWKNFVSDLRLKEARDWASAQVLMRAITNPSENPIERLAATLQTNTDINVVPPPPTPLEGQDDVSPEVLAVHNALKNSPAALASQNIRAAFQPFLAAETVDEKRQTQFDVFLTYARDVATWLQTAAEAADGTGRLLFAQYESGDQATPLAVLHNFAQRSDLPIIRNFGSALALTLDDAAMAFVTDYIESEWTSRIWGPYGSIVDTRFPFQEQSPTDISLGQFQDLLGPEGQLALFEQEFLGKFTLQPGVFERVATFLPQRTIGLSYDAEDMLIRARKITEAMFTDNKPHLEFRLRVSYMNPELSRMIMRSGITLHKFTHGPIVWTKQSWPLAGLQNSDLTLEVFNRSRPALIETFTGNWSWFRMSDGRYGSLDPTSGIAEVMMNADGLLLNVQFEVAQRNNPFGPGFFTNFHLPKRLFADDLS